MLAISDDKLNEAKGRNWIVYTKEPLHEGCECFESSDKVDSDSYYVSDVDITNIKHIDGKFYYTKEDLSAVSDWWPSDVLPIIGVFSSKKKHKLSKSGLVDVSKIPAFNPTNEDISVYDYRLFITLFNDYTVEQCIYDRWNFFDAKVTSSKFDLKSKLQNSDFLKSKDFTMINKYRQTEENVCIGIVIKEDNNYLTDYGNIYINMDNQISIVWH